MNELHLFLIKIWFILLILSIVFYVVLNGFDLGIGNLTLLQKKTALRSQMLIPLREVSGVNAAWLLLTGCVLFGAFPLGYTIIIHTMYIPVILLLSGLVMRRVGLRNSLRFHKHKSWVILIGCGSLLASLSQGLILGGILDGLSTTPVYNSIFIFSWLTPFTILTGIGVVLGYCLLGATFLLTHSGEQLAAQTRRWALTSATGALISFVILFSWLYVQHPQIGQHWLKPAPWIILITLLTAMLFSSIILFHTLRKVAKSLNNWLASPFFWSLVIFFLSFSGLAIILYPSLIPGHLSLQAAAASNKTLIFMIFGIGMLLPILLIYNGYQYMTLKNPDNTDKMYRTTDQNIYSL